MGWAREAAGVCGEGRCAADRDRYVEFCDWERIREWRHAEPGAEAEYCRVGAECAAGGWRKSDRLRVQREGFGVLRQRADFFADGDRGGAATAAAWQSFEGAADGTRHDR